MIRRMNGVEGVAERADGCIERIARLTKGTERLVVAIQNGVDFALIAVRHSRLSDDDAIVAGEKSTLRIG